MLSPGWNRFRSKLVNSWEDPFRRWLLITVLLSLSCYSIFDTPPYVDQVQGLWREADFLARRRFDYAALMNEPHFMSPSAGSRSYVISVLPTLLALLMRVVSSPPLLFQIAHLMTFGLAAWILAVMLNWLTPLVGARIAGLATLATALTPLFRVQVEMLGMEIPMIAAGITSLWLLSIQRPKTGLAFSLISFACKSTGMLFTLMFILSSIARFFAGRPTGKREGSAGDRAIRAAERKSAVRNGLLASMVLLGELLLLPVSGDPIYASGTSAAAPPILRWSHAILWCPDPFVLFAAGLLGSLAWCFKPGRRAPQRSFPKCATNDPRLGAALLAGGLSTLALLATSRLFFIPRYVAVGVPFFWIWSAIAFRQSVGPKWTSAALAAAVAIQALNGNGGLYLDVAARWPEEVNVLSVINPRSCALTERSPGEYRSDLESLRAALKTVDDESRSTQVFATLPYLALMESPRFGYVSTERTIVNAGHPMLLAQGLRSALAPSMKGSPDLLWIQPINVPGATEVMDFGPSLFVDPIRPMIEVRPFAREASSDGALRRARSAFREATGVNAGADAAQWLPFVVLLEGVGSAMERYRSLVQTRLIQPDDSRLARRYWWSKGMSWRIARGEQNELHVLDWLDYCLDTPPYLNTDPPLAPLEKEALRRWAGDAASQPAFDDLLSRDYGSVYQQWSKGAPWTIDEAIQRKMTQWMALVSGQVERPGIGGKKGEWQTWDKTLRALALCQWGEWLSARQLLEAELNEHKDQTRPLPESAETHLLLGTVLARLGDRTAAEGHWKTAQQLDPTLSPMRPSERSLGSHGPKR